MGCCDTSVDRGFVDLWTGGKIHRSLGSTYYPTMAECTAQSGAVRIDTDWVLGRCNQKEDRTGCVCRSEFGENDLDCCTGRAYNSSRMAAVVAVAADNHRRSPILSYYECFDEALWSYHRHEYLAAWLCGCKTPPVLSTRVRLSVCDYPPKHFPSDQMIVGRD